MVPSKAAETVIPSVVSLRWYFVFRSAIAPEITTVSKPKSSPPSAATTELFAR
jgi:hypothetical protein